MNYFYSLLFLFLNSFAFGQNKAYFQQDVNFKIDVSLDDEKHMLNGDWQMEYTNNSAEDLDFIYLHLWPNAFSNRSTAFAQQQLDYGSKRFYFTEDENLGYIDSLAFESNGQVLVQTATEMGPDVIKLILNNTLVSGETIIIKSPFRVKIPGSFSRLGHVGQSYQMTQWYPKPAVYDREGWHPMPYLDAGEFYSEFGAFDVSITLPANYLVGSTGSLLNKEERTWLLQKAAEDAKRSWTKDDVVVSEKAAFPESAAHTKTLHYQAEMVHDFAWFADKRFYVLHDTIQMAANRSIDAWSFFTDREADLWQHSMKYIKRSTHFYSDKVGEYPYPQVTALQSALSAGGGMEYPMVTVIGLSGDAQSLDEVIAHEVGHNWFYGILASNERDHAWMDEGFNSYYDQRYSKQYYQNENSLSAPFYQGEHSNIDEIAYRYFACRHQLKPADTPSGEVEGYNYWLGAYSIPSMAFQQLEEHIGSEQLDDAMAVYFQLWQFKHPRPQDAQSSLEVALSQPLDWLFDGFIRSSNTQDYVLQSVKKKDGNMAVMIKNKGQVAGPFPLLVINKEGVETIEKIDGFLGKKEILLPRVPYKTIQIDPLHKSMELNRQNNYWTTGWGRFEPMKIKLFSFKRDEKYSNLFLLPLVGFNKQDGLLAGVGFHNRTLLPKAFEFAILPFYGTRSKELTGLSALRYRLWPESKRIEEVSFHVNYRKFNFRTYDAENLPLAYRRFSPSIHVVFPRKGKWDKSLHLRSIWLDEEKLDFSSEGEFQGVSKRDRQINELSYGLDRNWTLAPILLKATVEQSNYTDAFNREQDYVKLYLEAKGKIYYERQSAFHWRFFVGIFLRNSLENSTFNPPSAFSIFDNGASDYRYDQLYFDRSANEGIGSQQLANREGGFRAPVRANFGLGRSNRAMYSVNMSVDVPFLPPWLPIKPYLDAALFTELNGDRISSPTLWNAGVAMEWLDGKIGVYLPLGGSLEIMDRLKEQGGIGQRFSFRVLLRDLSPWNWIDGIKTL